MGRRATEQRVINHPWAMISQAMSCHYKLHNENCWRASARPGKHRCRSAPGGTDSYLPDAAVDFDSLEQAERLAARLQDLSTRYGEQEHARVVNRQSLEGFLTSLRYWVRRSPAFIVERRAKYIGWEPTGLVRLSAQQMARRDLGEGGRK